MPSQHITSVFFEPSISTNYLHYYDIPYMRNAMPEPHYWCGARGEAIFHYLKHELLRYYAPAVEKSEDVTKVDRFAAKMKRTRGPLVETVEFFPSLWEINTNSTAQRRQDLLDVLNSGDMPPEDAPQPSEEELQEVLQQLTKVLLEARRRLSSRGGEIAMRRLNRREYAATINQLFGFDINVNLLPDDSESDSFDTVGADQFFSPDHFDQYLDVGKLVCPVKTGRWQTTG